MNDPIMTPAHYTVYPVQPIEITRYLGFCLGNATKYVLRAPYKGGVEDCDKAIKYLLMLHSHPQKALIHSEYHHVEKKIDAVLEFLELEGDILWKDISAWQGGFLNDLADYLFSIDEGDITSSAEYVSGMIACVKSLSSVLSLRDTTGQIYEGMTGLPIREADHE